MKSVKTVARFVLATQKAIAGVNMPDVTTRLQTVFGPKVISEKAIEKLLDENRSKY
jgi:hypothetical protein